jgi:hypothetical protein
MALPAYLIHTYEPTFLQLFLKLLRGHRYPFLIKLNKSVINPSVDPFLVALRKAFSSPLLHGRTVLAPATHESAVSLEYFVSCEPNPSSSHC